MPMETESADNRHTEESARGISVEEWNQLLSDEHLRMAQNQAYGILGSIIWPKMLCKTL